MAPWQGQGSKLNAGSAMDKGLPIWALQRENNWAMLSVFQIFLVSSVWFYGLLSFEDVSLMLGDGFHYYIFDIFWNFPKFDQLLDVGPFIDRRNTLKPTRTIPIHF